MGHLQQVAGRSRPDDKKSARDRQSMESAEKSIKGLKGDVIGATVVVESVNLAEHSQTTHYLESRSMSALNGSIVVAGAMMRSSASSKTPNITFVVKWGSLLVFAQPQDCLLFTEASSMAPNSVGRRKELVLNALG